DDLIDDENYRYGDFAVFYRTNAQSRAIDDALARSGIPYKVVGGTRFYERKAMKDALADLRVVANAADAVNLRRMPVVPKRSIGDRTEGLIADFADREGISFHTALGRLEEIPHLSSRALSSVRKFYDLMQDLASTAESSPLSRVIEAILEQSGYLESLQKSTDPQDESRVDNLAEREGISFHTALGRLEEIPHLSSRALSSVRKFYDLMQDLASTAESSPLSRVIEAILEQSGYLESLQKSTDPQDESRVDNLAE